MLSVREKYHMKKHTRSLSIMLAVLFIFSISDTVYAASKAKKDILPENPPLIGLKYGPGVPKGYEDLGGGIMADQRHALTEFGLQYVRSRKDEMMWFCRIVGKDPSGKPIFQIMDVLALPRRDKNEIVTWFACFFNGRRNEQIITYTDKYFFKVHRAWFADRQAGKIREISPQGIVCADPTQE